MRKFLNVVVVLFDMSINCESELVDKLSEDSGEIFLNSDIYISEGFKPIDEFSGILDGQGYTIYNLGSALISQITEDGVIENIKFKDLDFNEIVTSNNGEISSISIKVSNEDRNSKNQSNIIARDNSGYIEDCHVSGICTNVNFSVGGICSTNMGFIENCTVTDVVINGGTEVSGICSENEGGTVINCDVCNADLFGRKSIGGIIGSSEDGTVKECCVTDSKIESETYSSCGIIGRNRGYNNIQNCSVESTDISGENRVGVFSNHKEGDTILKSCFAQKCSLFCWRENDLELFTGVARECCITDTVLEGSLNFDSVEEVKDSYVNIKLIAANFSVETSDRFESLYMDIEKEHVSTDSKRVEVSKVEDFAEVGRFDTVELCNDIDLSRGSFKRIARFDGVFIGNGHTLSNLSKPLFIQCNGTVRDVCIDDFCITRYSKAGCIAKSGFGTTFENITVDKSTDSQVERTIYGIAYELADSKIIDSSVSIQDEADDIYGISNTVIDSHIHDCTVEIDISVNTKGFGFVETAIRSTIKNSSSTGELCINATDYPFSMSICGICGSADKVINCMSNVDITDNGYISNRVNVSGICGKGSEIKECTFTGTIDLGGNGENDGFRVGGITAQADSDSEILNCVNEGDITSISKYSVGGIAGESMAMIKNCKNGGQIIGKSSAGGIVGKIKNGSIFNSINKGDVLQADNCGGLVGCITNTSVQVQNCYSYSGKINSEDVLIGFIDEDAFIDEKENLELTGLLYIPTNETQSSKYGKETHEDPEKLNVILF